MLFIPQASFGQNSINTYHRKCFENIMQCRFYGQLKMFLEQLLCSIKIVLIYLGKVINK